MNKLKVKNNQRGVKMKGTMRAPGTCGELIQGTINNINFHITCPIDCFSYITVELNNRDYFTTNDPKRQKIIQAVNLTMLHIQGKSQGATINVNSQLPIAKGMASSTADIAAASMATAQALNYQLSYQELAQIALAIEPSDGLFFPGIVAFDHVKGKFYQKVGPSINLDIMVFDFGGTIDTIAFNQRKDLKEKNKINEPQIKKAFEFVEKGLKNNNPKLVAQGSTMSALLNQSIIFKPNLEEIIDLVIKQGALGINIAHSGTILGVLLEKDKTDSKQIATTLLNKYHYLSLIGIYKLMDGGVICHSEEVDFCLRSENMVAT